MILFVLCTVYLFVIFDFCNGIVYRRESGLKTFKPVLFVLKLIEFVHIHVVIKISTCRCVMIVNETSFKPETKRRGYT